MLELQSTIYLQSRSTTAPPIEPLHLLIRNRSINWTLTFHEPSHLRILRFQNTFCAYHVIYIPQPNRIGKKTKNSHFSFPRSSIRPEEMTCSHTCFDAKQKKTKRIVILPLQELGKGSSSTTSIDTGTATDMSSFGESRQGGGDGDGDGGCRLRFKAPAWRGIGLRRVL